MNFSVSFTYRTKFTYVREYLGESLKQTNELMSLEKSFKESKKDGDTLRLEGVAINAENVQKIISQVVFTFSILITDSVSSRSPYTFCSSS